MAGKVCSRFDMRYIPLLVGPLICYAGSWLIMSFFLHMTTVLWVHEATTNPARAEYLKDVGLDMISQRDVPLIALDFIATFGMVGFFISAAICRDVRLWAKVWFTCCLLFILKGFIDYVTVMPDSASWPQCQARLTPTGLAYLQELGTMHGSAFWSKFLSMEFTGIPAPNGKRLFPVRYCGDMQVSGHTFNLVVFFLGFVESVLKKAHKDIPHRAKLIGMVAYFIMVVAMLVEAYMILSKHFHYSADILSAILFAFLIYTNPVMTMFAKSWVDLFISGDVQAHMGVLWIPNTMLPCCCYGGFYEVSDELGIERHWPHQDFPDESSDSRTYDEIRSGEREENECP